MRTILILALLTLTRPLAAQNRRPTAADSALVGRILLAEDRRDSTDRSLADGARHADPRVRNLARRARGRIRDPRFAERDSLPALRAPTVWPEPAWRLRYRALTARRDDCGALREALADLAIPIRLRGADLVGPSCASDSVIVATLRAWVDALPVDGVQSVPDGATWHPAAHAIVALARVRPADAKPRLWRLATQRQWEPRMYAARAAGVLADTALLRVLVRDANDNVQETAIEGLAKLTGHADDTLFIALVRDDAGAQVVRAAATALKGSTHPDARPAAQAAFDSWLTRRIASAHDARVALLEAAGRPASDDRPPPAAIALPPRAVALALGADIRLRVTMAPASGERSFVVRLRGDVAPMMAARILELARSGYYNGLTWHRVEHDFVIQGGSPGANEYVGLPQFLRDELGTVPHVRGTVGMSTRGHDTGDAQWFVNLRDNLRLGRDYTVFGEVIEGMGVVDAILEGDRIERIEVVGS
jgi:cyclophilin family peptidyl-prolyl cis-trans isomerase